MLATGGPAPAGEQWAAEAKWDGMRAQVRFDGRVAGQTYELGVEHDPPTGEHPSELVELRELVRAAASRPRPDAQLACASCPTEARRELLAELALDGPSWRTPAHFVGRAAELAAATADQGLEGVAKRLDSPWTPGRRTPCWVKTKHRRRETLAITGWRERRDEPEEFLVARRAGNGELVPAGAVSLGLAAAQRADLLGVLAARELPRRRRRGIRWSATLVEATVDFHGRRDGPVRDAVVREVHLRAEG